MAHNIGPVILFGSGETSATAQAIYAWAMQSLSPPVRASVLETPAGFQLNSADVAEAVADYLRVHLQNYRPEVHVVAARKRGTFYSPDNIEVLRPLLTSEMIFLGPGSPTYAVRQLRDSLAWRILQARHRMGYPIAMASAATIAASAWALPVYEIYKVGEDIHWARGLDFWQPFGLNLVFVPHWNNSEGGDKHDTSHCYMGEPRFADMLALLPEGLVVVGIDEHTALVVAPAQRRCQVMGVGNVTLIRDGQEQRFVSGTSFPCSNLGDWHAPDGDDLPASVWQMIADAELSLAQGQTPSQEVLELVAQRQQARANQAWAQSDQLRDRIAALGWQVRDTPKGPELEPLS